MQLENVGQQLLEIIKAHVTSEAKNWLEEKITSIIGDQSAKDLYLTYSLIPTKVALVNDVTHESHADSNFGAYLKTQKANSHQISRIYVLYRVLDADHTYFMPKVAKLIEVADIGEMETFLKFLIALPNPGDYKNMAVDALRTNISTIFNALAYHNPYPALYFDDRQWNQMYLKTAFMQGDLSAIADIDERANEDLARIISDYAHERWAAGRDIDPDFWRPVQAYIEGPLLADMERLLGSENGIENRAGALCCYHSGNVQAKKLLYGHQELVQRITNKDLSWATLKKE